MDTNNGHTDDPFDCATNATPAPRSYYGRIQLDAWFCALIKGTGRVPYDDSRHKPEQRCTAMDVELAPLPEQNVSFPVRRKMIAESREWTGIVRPSLMALGLSNVREADGKWGKLVEVPTGRKYRTNTGEDREPTTFKFLALYSSEDECRKAYFAEVKRQPEAEEPLVATAPQAPASGGGSKARETAVQFIAAFAKLNKYDLDATRRACAAQPAISTVIDVNSPEFVQIVAEATVAGK